MNNTIRTYYVHNVGLSAYVCVHEIKWHTLHAKAWGLERNGILADACGNKKIPCVSDAYLSTSFVRQQRGCRIR